jgi:hypothetical protein
MYHITIIDDASLENEQKSSNLQEKVSPKANEMSKKHPSLPERTPIFLARYLNKNSNVRIFVNKD